MGLDSYFYTGGDFDSEIHYLRKIYSVHDWFCDKIKHLDNYNGDVEEYKMSKEELEDLIIALLHDSAIFYDIMYGRGYAERLSQTLILSKPNNDMYDHYYNEYERLLNSLLKAQKEDLVVYYSGNY
jgi:hypothetical protein